MISFKLSEGKKPPFEIKVIARLRELNNLISEIEDSGFGFEET